MRKLLLEFESLLLGAPPRGPKASAKKPPDQPLTRDEMLRLFYPYGTASERRDGLPARRTG